MIIGDVCTNNKKREREDLGGRNIRLLVRSLLVALLARSAGRLSSSFVRWRRGIAIYEQREIRSKHLRLSLIVLTAVGGILFGRFWSLLLLFLSTSTFLTSIFIRRFARWTSVALSSAGLWLFLRWFVIFSSVGLFLARWSRSTLLGRVALSAGRLLRFRRGSRSSLAGRTGLVLARWSRSFVRLAGLTFSPGGFAVRRGSRSFLGWLIVLATILSIIVWRLSTRFGTGSFSTTIALTFLTGFRLRTRTTSGVGFLLLITIGRFAATLFLKSPDENHRQRMSNEYLPEMMIVGCWIFSPWVAFGSNHHCNSFLFEEKTVVFNVHQDSKRIYL